MNTGIRHVKFAASILLLLISIPLHPAFGQGISQLAFNRHEMGGFITASLGDRSRVAVQLLSERGRGGALLKSLHDTGAELQFADEKVGYALVVVATDKLLDTLDLPNLASASAIASDKSWIYRDGPERSYVPLVERRPKPVPPITLPIPRVGTSLPEDGPYFAAEEAGLVALWKNHPTADGRGVRVAVVDEGLDLLHPSVQLARDRDGRTVPKVADIMTLSDPAKSASWVQFGKPIKSVNGRIAAAGRTWNVPDEGSYRFGIYTNEFYLGFDRYWEKKQDPRLKQLSLSVGVLWDESKYRVWIDTDGDGDFRNQRALGDYAETKDVDWFGRKQGDNDNRIPFGVKIDRQRKAAYLSIAHGGHGAVVAGPLAANRRTGGLFDGAAPNAQLVDVLAGPFWPALLSAFARPDVDIINRSGGIGAPLDDGSGDFDRELLTRAIEVYKKPFAACSGAPNSFNVMDYAGPELLRRNRQTLPPYVDYINGFVFFCEDGLVNTIAAPSAQLGTESRYLPYDFVSEDGKRYDDRGRLEAFAPPGYSIGANPSPTIPVVSGVVADLISEARRQHIRYDCARLTQAVLTGARWINGIPSSTQGYGLVNAAGAWEQLARMASADDPANPVLTSFTAAVRENGRENGQLRPVNGFHADIPKAPDVRQAGMLAGELWLTRNGGYETGRDYQLSVRGDEGTYKILDQQITFVRDRPERVRFDARLTGGLHVGFLQLRDAQAGVVMQEVPLSVRVAERPELLAPFVEHYRQTIPPRRVRRLYVRFGAETQAARYVMRIPYVGIPDLFCGLPDNRQINNVAPTGEPVDPAHHVGPMQNIEMVALNKLAETKWIYWSNRGGSEYEGPSDPPAPDVPINAELRLEKYAVAFERPNKQRTDKQRVRVTNKQAEIRGRVEFYDAKLASAEVAGSGRHALATWKRVVPANLAQWRIAAAWNSACKEGADAFLLDCTSKTGSSVVDAKSMTRSGATFVVDNPKAGEWRIVIRARGVVQEAGSYTIREALLRPSAGSKTLSHSDGRGQGEGPPENLHKDTQHASQSSWQVPVPEKSGDAQYVAFIIAGKPFRIVDDAGKEAEKYKFALKAIDVPAYSASSADMRIAMTPLDPGAP